MTPMRWADGLKVVDDLMRCGPADREHEHWRTVICRDIDDRTTQLVYADWADERAGRETEGSARIRARLLGR